MVDVTPELAEKIIHLLAIFLMTDYVVLGDNVDLTQRALAMMVGMNCLDLVFNLLTLPDCQDQLEAA